MKKKAHWMDRLIFKVKKYSPEILFGIGVAGVIAIPIISAIGTMKAQDRIEEYYEEVPEEEERDKKELAKRVVPCYIPTVAACGLTISAFAGGKKIADGRAAAVLSLLISERKSKDILIEKMKEKFGQGKTEDVIAAANVEAHKANINEQEEFIKGCKVINTGLGDVLFFDKETATYFRACEDAVRKAENYINRKLTQNAIYVSMNDFLEQLNLPWMGMCEDIGWEACDHHLEVHIDYTRFRGEPLGEMTYKPYPLYSSLAAQKFA